MNIATCGYAYGFCLVPNQSPSRRKMATQLDSIEISQLKALALGLGSEVSDGPVTKAIPAMRRLTDANFLVVAEPQLVKRREAFSCTA